MREKRDMILTDNADVPSTSSQDFLKCTEDKRSELAARLLSQIRANRDRREAQLCKLYRNDRREWVEEQVRSKVGEELTGVNSHIQMLEVKTLGAILEDLLRIPHYVSQLTQSPGPSSSRIPPVQHRSPGKTLQPIEINIEDNCSIASADSVTAPHSLLSVFGESNMEKAARQEANIIGRVAELRRQGLWSASLLPLCVEPAKKKAHWDFLLEEMQWMAQDFRQEKKFKSIMAKKISTAILKQKKDEEMEVERAELRAVREAKRVCAAIAKMVRDFWINVDKVVDIRVQEIVDTKKKQAMDKHLAFLVGEADKISSIVQEGLTQEKTPSIASKTDEDDREFFVTQEESDDESTIDKDEKGLKDEDVSFEVNALSQEADQDLDDVLATLPKEYLASLGITDLTALQSSAENVTTNKAKVVTSPVSQKELESNPEGLDETSQDGTEKSQNDDQMEGNGDGRGVLMKVDYSKLNSVNSEERQQELDNIAEEALKFQPKGYTLETTQVKTEVPFLVRGKLREYQMVGLDWLVTLYEKNLNGILADEMGLGKTIQTISLLAHLACSESIWGPHLIVVPTSVILNWEMEIKKWCPALKILTYFGSTKDRAEKRKGWSKPNAFHVCITSYKTITTDIRSFKMRAWQYLILDEAQNIKNWKSQRWQALLNIRARRRLLLTGTPLQNSLMELWSLMHFLMPAIFSSHDDFKDWFSNPLTGMMEGSVEYNKPLVDRLHKVLRPFILRRLKSEVEKQLPAKTEYVINCQLSKRQRYLYDDFMSQRETKDKLKSGSMMSVLNIVMQLRKCCNHPNLFEPRSVVSPFVMHRVQRGLPSILYDICGENARLDDSHSIPDLFNLRKRLSGWTGGIDTSRPMITENMEEICPAGPPTIAGFKFQRPPLARNELCGSSARTPSAVDLDIAELRRSGFGEDSEMFFVVKEDDDVSSLLNNSKGAPIPMRVRVLGDRVSYDNDDSNSPEQGRLCQLVTINGQQTFRDFGVIPVADIPQYPSRDSPKTISIRNADCTQENQVIYGADNRRTVPRVHPSLQTSTSVSCVGQLTVSTDSLGFHHDMSNGGSRSQVADFNYQFSPPLKRRKGITTGPTQDDFDSCVPTRVKSAMQTGINHRLALLSGRFSKPSSIIFPNELLKLLKEDMVATNQFEKGFTSVQNTCDDLQKMLVSKFTLFVDSVITDAPVIEATSSGRPFYAVLNEQAVKSAARAQLQAAHPLTDTKLLSSRIQLPEIRLIEYDCGKLQVLGNLLRDLFLYKHRCLIFTQMSKMLDILQAFLSFHGYQYFRMDGTTGIEQRQAMMERFNSDPKIFCFILSTRSGGVGVNLTGADTVIFYDSDWNPTMDAQAQDRCHRIGQTRNVSIYRLISERTIEENILKKARQKKKLNDIAIDDAGFRPEFFKQADNLRDLFEGEDVASEIVAAADAPSNEIEMERAMASCEDEQDVAAARLVSAEARVDKAEFDDAKYATSQLGDVESTDEKYIELINQLKPIERYALNFLEAEYKPELEEEIREAEAITEQKKEEWVKAQTHNDNEMAGVDEDDEFYGCGSFLDEILAEDPEFSGQLMPTWCPPTPPLSDGENDLVEGDDFFDIYFDKCLDLLYDQDFMGEAKLPPAIHELHRPLSKSNSPLKRRNQTNTISHENQQHRISNYSNGTERERVLNILGNMKQEEDICISSENFMNSDVVQNHSPNTDIPDNKPGDLALKREKRKEVRPKDIMRAVSPPLPVREELDYEGPEWSIIEDNALLEAVQTEDALRHHIDKIKSALRYNWEFVSGYVNRVTGFYRSPRQCCIRYQAAVRPRENNQLVAMDPVTKKSRKIQLTPGETAHLRKSRMNTKDMYNHDMAKIVNTKVQSRLKCIRSLSERTSVSYRRNIENTPIDSLSGRMPIRHESKFMDMGINISYVVIAEDFASLHEGRHFTNQKSIKDKHNQDSRVVPSTPRFNVSVRPPAVTANPQSVVSKAPYKIDIAKLNSRAETQLQTTQHIAGLQISQDHLGPTLQTTQTVARRVQSVGSNLSQLIQPPSAQHNYVVVDQPGIRVQQRQDSGINHPGYRPVQTQVKRTPPVTPMTSINRPQGFMTNVSVQNSNYASNPAPSSSVSAVYSNSPSGMAAGLQRTNQGRLVSRAPPTQGRVFMTPSGSIGERTFVMQQPQQLRMMPGQQRVAQPKRAMSVVMQQRPGMQQIRTVTRGNQMIHPGGGRIMMVSQQPQMRTAGSASGQIIQGSQGNVTRQLLAATRGMNTVSRGASPQTVAQVVITPPSQGNHISSQSSISGSANNVSSSGNLSSSNVSPVTMPPLTPVIHQNISSVAGNNQQNTNSSDPGAFSLDENITNAS